MNLFTSDLDDLCALLPLSRPVNLFEGCTMTDTVITNPARWAAMALLVTSLQAGAQTTPKFADAQTSDPATLGWMVGSPPPTDKLVQFADGTFRKFPQIRWSFSNYRQFVPTSNVARGTGPVSVLPVAARQDIDGVTFQVIGSGETMNWAQSLDANYTDGIVVLHRGRIVYERYFGVFKPQGQHIAMSVTKSFIGTIGAMLVAEGAIDENELASKFVPELKDSWFWRRHRSSATRHDDRHQVLRELCRSQG